MSEVAEKKKVIHQGRNVKITRESKGLYQKDLADKLNKQQSDISKIESQEIIDDELLNLIALALEVPVDFLKSFDLESATKTYNNNATINSAEKSQDVVNQGDQSQTFNYFPLEQVMEMTTKLLNMQKEHYEKEMELLGEKHELDKENALLKQELAFFKKK